MPDHPFSNPAFAALGGQMVQMWQEALDSWWTALLSDSGRLSDLGRRLADTGASAPTGASTEDLGRVIEALELMQTRMVDLEGQVQELTESLATVVGFLEQQSAAQAGAGESEGAE